VAAAAAAGSPRAGLTLAVSSGPHLPDPPLKFASPGVQFVPVPAVTGFAAYWERDPLRSTAYPSPIDQLTRCSSLAQRSHASIPGIWLQETDKQLRVIVKPRFLPSGLPCYTGACVRGCCVCVRARVLAGLVVQGLSGVLSCSGVGATGDDAAG
jgi:hypothetical protein